MSDKLLLVVGSCVFFIFLVGCYIYAREVFTTPRARDSLLTSAAPLRILKPGQESPA